MRWLKSKAEPSAPWETRFAWRRVEINGHWVWLEWVERCLTGFHHDDPVYTYRDTAIKRAIAGAGWP